MEKRGERLLELIRQGLQIYSENTSGKQLGDRTKYVGLSDVAAFVQCPRSALLHRLSYKKGGDSFSRTWTLGRGHILEDGVSNALFSLNVPCMRQLEIALDNEGKPVQAHLDFVLVSTHPKPTIRILEVKTCARLPDVLYPSYETQVLGQVGLFHKCYALPQFSLRDEHGEPVCAGMTFPQLSQKLWGISLPDEVKTVDLEAWVLCLSMTDAKAFGPYLPDENITNFCLSTASRIWTEAKAVQNGQKGTDELDTASGFHPLCEHCDWNSDCPKFRGLRHPELSSCLDKLQTWKEQRRNVDETIRQHEQFLKGWYANSDAQGRWIDAGKQRFRTSELSGRKTLDKAGLMEELSKIFQSKAIDDIDVPALFARHEKVGEPAKRLTICSIKKGEPEI